MRATSGIGTDESVTLIDSRSAITRTQRQYKGDSRVSVMEQSGSVRLFRDSLLLGENPAEFEELHQALIAEVAPTGALGEDIVADLARPGLAQAKFCNV